MDRENYPIDLHAVKYAQVGGQYLPVTRPGTRDMGPRILDALIETQANAFGTTLVPEVEKAVTTYALASMSDAIGVIAQRVLRSSEPLRLGGGEVEFINRGDVGGGRMQFVVTQRAKPGAYLWEVGFKREMTDQAQAMLSYLKKQQVVQCEEMGLDPVDYLLRAYDEKSRTDLQRRERKLLADPASYGAASTGTELIMVSIQSILSKPDKRVGYGLPGWPEAVEHAGRAAELSVVVRPITLSNAPSIILAEQRVQRDMKRSPESHPSFDTISQSRGHLLPALAMMSKAISTNKKLVELCEANADAISATECVSYGTSAILEEYAIASVWSDGGLVGQGTLSAMANLQGRVWSNLLEKRLEVTESAVRLLAENGHTEFGARYQCNELREQAWADIAEDGYVLTGFNDNSSFRLACWESNGRLRLSLRTGRRSETSDGRNGLEITGGDSRVADAHFVMTTRGLRMEGASQELNIRHMMDMNEAILSMEWITANAMVELSMPELVCEY